MIRLFGPLLIRELHGRKPFRGSSVLHERLPPNYKLPDIYHERTHELVVVIKGSMTGVLNGRRMRLSEGDSIHLPPGARHQFTSGKKTVDCLSIFSPPLSFKRLDIKRA